MRQYKVVTTDSDETEHDQSLWDIAHDYKVDGWELDAIADMTVWECRVVAGLTITRTADIDP